jgi:hypothetical protein
LILLVPQDFKLIVKQALGVLERDVFCCAASWGHVLRVLHREGELTLETRVAHAVAARKFDGFVHGKLIIHADETVDPGQVSMQAVKEHHITYIGTALCTGPLGVRVLGLEKRLEKIPPVLLRAASFVD